MQMAVINIWNVGRRRCNIDWFWHRRRSTGTRSEGYLAADPRNVASKSTKFVDVSQADKRGVDTTSPQQYCMETLQKHHIKMPCWSIDKTSTSQRYCFKGSLPMLMIIVSVTPLHHTPSTLHQCLPNFRLQGAEETYPGYEASTPRTWRPCPI